VGREVAVARGADVQSDGVSSRGEQAEGDERFEQAGRMGGARCSGRCSGHTPLDRARVGAAARSQVGHRTSQSTQAEESQSNTDREGKQHRLDI
jgi:hypothetical protein